MSELLSRITRKHLLIAAAAAAVVIMLVLIATAAGRKNPELSAEAAQTRSRLEAMENRDVGTVRTEIEMLTKDGSPSEETASQSAEDSDSPEDSSGQTGSEAAEESSGETPVSESSYMELFSDSLFMGDSVIHDLDVYGLVNSSNIIAENGVSLEELDDAIATAAALSPRNIFLYYGFNDIGHQGDDYESFRWLYENLLIRLREVLPDSAIYVNSIFPVHDLDTLQNGWYADVTPYNNIIADLCAQYGIPFLDHTYLVKDEYYYDDGYHFIYEFYPLWLDAMAREAGLLE